MLLRPLDKKIVTALYLFLSFVATILFSFSHGRRKTAFRRDAMRWSQENLLSLIMNSLDLIVLTFLAQRWGLCQGLLIVSYLQLSYFVNELEIHRSSRREACRSSSQQAQYNWSCSLCTWRWWVLFLRSWCARQLTRVANFINSILRLLFNNRAIYEKMYFHHQASTTEMSDKDRPESWAIDPTWWIPHWTSCFIF